MFRLHIEHDNTVPREFNLVIMYFRVTRKRIFRFTTEENRIIAFCHIGIYQRADVSASANLYLSRLNLSFESPQFANHAVQSIALQKLSTAKDYPDNTGV